MDPTTRARELQEKFRDLKGDEWESATGIVGELVGLLDGQCQLIAELRRRIGRRVGAGTGTHCLAGNPTPNGSKIEWSTHTGVSIPTAKAGGFPAGPWGPASF